VGPRDRLSPARAFIYPPEFRREAIELWRAGRAPRELSESLGVSEQTLRIWRRQDQIDRHERDDGVTSDERAELAAVADALNSRPRKTLGWRTPAEVLDEHLAAAA
jgi:transposase